jgi:hypothetical protein
MNKVSQVAFAFVLFLMGSSAWANLDISCVDGDCFSYGWITLDTRTNNESTVVCRDFDCLGNGWFTEYKNNLASEVFCKPDGCFNEGWTVYDPRSGRTVADVSCQTSFANSDCLQYGWVTTEPGRGSYVTRCVNGDCRNIGWDVQVPGYAAQPVRCKQGGCFNSGWTVYR